MNKIIKDLYRGINDFKKGYQPRTKTVKDGNGDLFTDTHSIVTRWRKLFSQLLNVQSVNDIMQTEIQTAEPLVPEPNVFEAEKPLEKLKTHKLAGTDHISAEMIKAGGRTTSSEIHKLNNPVCKKEELPETWKKSITVPVYKKGDKPDCIKYTGISFLSTM